MRAHLNQSHSVQVLLTLTPETDDERLRLKALAEQSARAMLFNCRGFTYMEPSVEFLLQPMPGRD